eukprot:scaffold99895_cov61-Phaeocystis_antarctica.AAC.3
MMPNGHPLFVSRRSQCDTCVLRATGLQLIVQPGPVEIGWMLVRGLRSPQSMPMRNGNFPMLWGDGE